MSKYPATPEVGYQLPVPGSLQPWKTIDFNALFTQTEAAVHADRLRLTALEAATNNALVPAGSGAARDALYGVPATATDRVALANQGARWYNTDAGKGYEELYYAKTGDAGAPTYTAATPGWYPFAGIMPRFEGSITSVAIGNSTELVLGATSGVLTAPWVEISDITPPWHDPTTNPTQIKPNIAGRYKLNMYMNSGSSGAKFMHARKNSDGATAFKHQVLYSSLDLASDSVASESEIWDLNGTTDFIDFTAFQNSGAALTMSFMIGLSFVRPTP